MDYLEIVLKSITEKDYRGDLDGYFYGQFEIAQRERPKQVKGFFIGCQSVIEEWEQSIKDRYKKRREQLEALASVTSSPETKEQCESELKDMRLDDFPLNLAIQTNRKAIGFIKYSELQPIKKAIGAAAEQFGVKQSHADTAYEITTPILEAILSTDSYHSFKYAIDEKGFYIIRRDDQRIKVYSPELMAIFTTENLPVLERNKKTDTTINGKDYLEFYLKGYNEGATYFKENYTLPPNVLYGENAKPYVMDLHHNCFHKEIRFGFNGWYSFKKSYPTLISQKVIKEFGYYAGIISMVEELASNHPRLFETFEKCEQSENSESEIKEVGTAVKENETLESIITHTKAKEIVEAIKIQYKKIKGKELKLLLMALQKTNLLPNSRIASKFHRCCKKEFDWDIASLQAMNDCTLFESDSKLIEQNVIYLQQLKSKLETK